jgi:hypothetical protein
MINNDSLKRFERDLQVFSTKGYAQFSRAHAPINGKVADYFTNRYTLAIDGANF